MMQSFFFFKHGACLYETKVIMTIRVAPLNNIQKLARLDPYYFK